MVSATTIILISIGIIISVLVILMIICIGFYLFGSINDNDDGDDDGDDDSRDNNSGGATGATGATGSNGSISFDELCGSSVAQTDIFAESQYLSGGQIGQCASFEDAVPVFYDIDNQTGDTISISMNGVSSDGCLTIMSEIFITVNANTCVTACSNTIATTQEGTSYKAMVQDGQYVISGGAVTNYINNGVADVSIFPNVPDPNSQRVTVTITGAFPDYTANYVFVDFDDDSVGCYVIEDN